MTEGIAGWEGALLLQVAHLCGDVLCDSRPEEGYLGPSGHAADALVGGVEGVEACGA